MGIHLARYKTMSFAISAALAGLGGALYAHKLSFISPDQFSILQSIDLLLMVVIGGLGSVHGAFLGAIFLIAMPQLISIGQGLAAGGHRPGAGVAGPGVWPGADRLRAVRAAGAVRPLAEDPHLAAAVSVLPAGACSSGRSPSPSRTGCDERRHSSLRQGPERALRRRAGGQQGELRRAAGRGVHADRPERRGQDDGVQPDQPHLHADHGRDHRGMARRRGRLR